LPLILNLLLRFLDETPAVLNFCRDGGIRIYILNTLL
jgi:hypothetical protein